MSLSTVSSSIRSALPNTVSSGVSAGGVISILTNTFCLYIQHNEAVNKFVAKAGKKTWEFGSKLIGYDTDGSENENVDPVDNEEISNDIYATWLFFIVCLFFVVCLFVVCVIAVVTLCHRFGCTCCGSCCCVSCARNYRSNGRLFTRSNPNKRSRRFQANKQSSNIELIDLVEDDEDDSMKQLTSNDKILFDESGGDDDDSDGDNDPDYEYESDSSC